MFGVIKKGIDATGLFAPPPEAEEGFEEFRPVSGFSPIIRMEPGPRTSWINEDLVPSPPQMHVWTGKNYVTLWLTGNFDAGSWSGGSSLISIGLTIGQAMGVTVLGALMCSLIAIAAARIGAMYHIGYPAWARTTYGMRGSKIMVAFRGAVAIIWYAVQTYFGAEMLDVVLYAIFGLNWKNIPNHMSPSSGTTTKNMVAYFIFWCIQLPFLFVHPSTARQVFMVKGLLIPIAAAGYIGAMVHHAGGKIDFAQINNATSLTGSTLGWTFMAGINSIFGSISPMLINQPDVARYAATPKAAMWWQFWPLWTGKILGSFLGMITCAAISQVYGVVTWNAWDQCTLVLDAHGDNYGWRIGIALFGLVSCFGTIGTNLFANTIPFGADMSGTFPKHLNILRGQLVCVVFSWAICPWLILTSGAKFVQFLGSYTVFMASLMSILLVDYYFVRKGNLHIPSLYDATGDKVNPGGLYYIGPKSYNWKGFLAWTIGVVPIIPGLAYTFMTGATLSPTQTNLVHLYNCGFVFCFTLSAVVYYALNKAYPPAIFPAGHEDAPLVFEGLAASKGYFPGEATITFGRGVIRDSESSIEYAASTPEDEKMEKDMAKTTVVAALEK